MYLKYLIFDFSNLALMAYLNLMSARELLLILSALFMNPDYFESLDPELLLRPDFLLRDVNNIILLIL